MIFLFFFSFFGYSAFVDDRTISGSIIANWTETPYIAETLAFLEDVDHAIFWDMLDSLSTEKTIPSTLDSVLKYAETFVDDELLSLLNFSLQIRFYSPRIEFYRSLAPVKKDHFLLCRNSIIEINEDINEEITSEKLEMCETDFQNYEATFGCGNSTIAFYVNIEKSGWNPIFQKLQKLEKNIKFVVRPIGFSDKPMKMMGYGVQLRPFKYSMEFRVNDETKFKIPSTNKTFKKVDFSHLGLKIDQKSKKIDNSFKKPKLDNLPFQFATFSKNSFDPVHTIRELTTNFPLFSKQITKVQINDSILRNYQRSPQFSSPGQTALFINGRKMQGHELNYYSIYQALLEEYRSIKILKDSFEFDDELIQIFKKTGNSPKIVQNPMIDARSKLFVYWMNNLETDEKYTQKYPKSLFAFANENGKFPGISRNIANAIFILDPSEISDLDTFNILEELIAHQFPCRFGYIISPSKRSPLSKKIYYAYTHLALKYGMKSAHKLISKVNDMRGIIDEKTGKLGSVKQTFWDKAFGSIAVDRKSPSFKTINDLFKEKTDETRFIQRVNEFIRKLGISSPSMILNGKYIDAPNPERFLHSMLDDEVQTIREMISKRVISDSTEDFHDVFLSQHGVSKRYNKLIQIGKKSFTETLQIQSECTQNQRTFVKWMSSIKYQYGTSTGVKMQTFWVFQNCEEDIRREVECFMSEIAKIEETRLAFFNRDLDTNLSSSKSSIPKNNKYYDKNDANKINEIPDTVARLLNIKIGLVTVIFNGRIVHLNPSQFSRFDLQLLQDWEKSFSTDWAKHFNDRYSKKRTLSVSRPIREISDYLLFMTMIASSTSHNYINQNSDVNQENSNNYHAQCGGRSGSPFKTFKNRAVNVYRSPKNTSLLNVHLLINPFTVEGQRLSCILSLLKSYSFGLMLNPSIQQSKLENDQSNFDTLSSFYSFADSQNDGDFNFMILNQSTTYSVVPDIPPTWQILRESALFDLDNVIADSMEQGTHQCRFKLSSIFIEGNTQFLNDQNMLFDSVELKLFNKNNKQLDETLSIPRNGYFQLKSSPGSFSIVTNTDEQFKTTLDSFLPKFHFQHLKKDISSNVKYNWNNFTMEDDNKIHIFIVASGHLYERLERIMMLSAVKHTSHIVKFWILENFVSPQHRQILPTLAKKYKFEYEFTSYNWPRWLTQETQQQRIFWGYKILFLDVMFPNHLKRVIYVDADDVIRADFFELMELNMKGAPYGFTPFCEDRPEMEEYRFWNDGYWRNILNGKKYHISAMFVVDLVQFRKKNIGDLLRKAYEDLSSDKASLSNLDQDLPNVLQTKGAEIFSLPLEWLWCGSWCSDETMPKAKTIDLCNNPRTKESKLEYAKKTIKEWKELDKEINGDFVSDEL
ncbi:hypothetical protein TRFO_15576 [Tritrichomonas foetus]|uniref:Uncharacterized protein n=1 Tax=Tritrichomonas foetus TaxID=1144522 RepID=A0A1J4KWZ6_9EUKA|nr:hypothetical protein TRFO_15576 [Tritrichomonas foetus]|eukprot:OHT14069.1 hypothetical protein TRFO_15576 [Tritrichomonas foetus]